MVIASKALPWTWQSIPFDQLDYSRFQKREDLFLLLVAASFIEAASDAYAHNLAEYFKDDLEMRDWLLNQWEPEELQHGLALRTYVGKVWPEFDWDTAFRDFFEVIGPTCRFSALEKEPALEMVARCVVETGTATIYHALYESTDELVLRTILKNIKRDELRHYRYFYNSFKKYREINPISRWQVLGALRRRLLKARDMHTELALKHAFDCRHSPSANPSKQFRSSRANAAKLLRPHYPLALAMRMLLRPLLLPSFLEQSLALLGRVVGIWFFRWSSKM